MPILDLGKLQALCDAATDGEWYQVAQRGSTTAYSVSTGEFSGFVVDSAADAKFIVASRTAMPQLIARVRELERADRSLMSRFDDARFLVKRLREQADKLEARQQELLELIVRISRDCIMTDEADERGQIAAVVAECGTLRSKLRDV